MWVDDPSFSYFSSATVKSRLNLAQREVQKRLISANYQYYVICVKTNTVTNQAEYALPSDFMQVIRLERVLSGSGSLINTQQIMPVTPNQKNTTGGVSGAPAVYYFEKNNIILMPTPDAAYEIHLHYSYNVDDMSADGDTPDCPEQFHEYIAVLATRDCLFQDQREIASIQYKLDHYEKLLKEIAVQRNADATRMVTVTGDNGWGW